MDRDDTSSDTAEGSQREVDIDDLELSNLQMIEYYVGRFVETKVFQVAVIATILLSSIVLGLETSSAFDDNTAIPKLEMAITFIFLCEVLFKITATIRMPLLYFFSKKEGPNFWNIFDFIVTVLCLMNIRSVSVIRLVRMLRLLKVVRQFPTLQLLIVGVLSSMEAIAKIFLLLVIVIYFFSMLGIEMMRGDTVDGDFENLHTSAIVLFELSMGGSWSEMLHKHAFECFENSNVPTHWPFCTSISGDTFLRSIYFAIFIFISRFTVLILIIGIMTFHMDRHRIDSRRASDYFADRDSKPVRPTKASRLIRERAGSFPFKYLAKLRLLQPPDEFSPYFELEQRQMLMALDEHLNGLLDIRNVVARALHSDEIPGKVPEEHDFNFRSLLAQRGKSQKSKGRRKRSLTTAQPNRKQAPSNPPSNPPTSRLSSERNSARSSIDVRDEISDATARASSDRQSAEQSASPLLSSRSRHLSVKPSRKKKSPWPICPYRNGIADSKDFESGTAVWIQISNVLAVLTRSRVFRYLMLVAVCLSCIVEGLKTYRRFSPCTVNRNFCNALTWTDTALDCLFCLELLLKIFACGFRPWRFVFYREDPLKLDVPHFADTIVVCFILAGKLKAVRGLRIYRFIAMSNRLRGLMRQLTASLKTLGLVIVLGALVLYVYSVGGVFLFAKINPIDFGSLGLSVSSLLQCVTGDSTGDVLYPTINGCQCTFCFWRGTSNDCGDATPLSRAGASIFFLTFILVTAMGLLKAVIALVIVQYRNDHDLKLADAATADFVGRIDGDSAGSMRIVRDRDGRVWVEISPTTFATFTKRMLTLQDRHSYQLFRLFSAHVAPLFFIHSALLSPPRTSLEPVTLNAAMERLVGKILSKPGAGKRQGSLIELVKRHSEVDLHANTTVQSQRDLLRRMASSAFTASDRREVNINSIERPTLSDENQYDLDGPPLLIPMLQARQTKDRGAETMNERLTGSRGPTKSSMFSSPLNLGGSKFLAPLKLFNFATLELTHRDQAQEPQASATLVFEQEGNLEIPQRQQSDMNLLLHRAIQLEPNSARRTATRDDLAAELAPDFTLLTPKLHVF